MSGVTVRCSHCSVSLKVKDRRKLGSKVTCPKCKQPFVMRAADEPANDEWDSVPELPPTGGRALPPVQHSRRSGGSTKSRRKAASGMSGGMIGLLIGGGLLVIGLLVAGGDLGGRIPFDRWRRGSCGD